MIFACIVLYAPQIIKLKFIYLLSKQFKVKKIFENKKILTNFTSHWSLVKFFQSRIFAKTKWNNF